MAVCHIVDEGSKRAAQSVSSLKRSHQVNGQIVIHLSVRPLYFFESDDEDQVIVEFLSAKRTEIPGPMRRDLASANNKLLLVQNTPKYTHTRQETPRRRRCDGTQKSNTPVRDLTSAHRYVGSSLLESSRSSSSGECHEYLLHTPCVPSSTLGT